MGELVAIIQRHLDSYGVTEATFARRMGVNPQTINAWKTRGGIKRLPERRILEAVARETRTSYAEVLEAALVDTGYAAVGSATDEPGRRPEVQESDAGAAQRPAPHSTPLTEADIAAGARLPLAEPRHRRSARSSGTTPRRHTS